MSEGYILDTQEDLVRLGKGPTSNIVFRDHQVCSEHASIVSMGDDYILRDHHSVHGTHVIRKGNTIHLNEDTGWELFLKRGDIVELGAGEPVKLVLTTIKKPKKKKKGLPKLEEDPEIIYFRRREENRSSFVLGSSPAMTEIAHKLKEVADTRLTVLVSGESGVGKSALARNVHYMSDRRREFFAQQSCIGVSNIEIESLLFGSRGKIGLFEATGKGTLLLDDVECLSLATQSRLLDVLKTGEFTPFTAYRPRPFTTRLVVTTNKNLEKEIESKHFIKDLYYRLKSFPIKVPPLRKRKEDMPELCTYFIKKYAEEYRIPLEGISQAAIYVMQQYKWPKNVRELENEVQRLVLQGIKGYAGPVYLSPKVGQKAGVLRAVNIEGTHGTLQEMKREFEKELLIDFLIQNNNNKTHTAKALSMTREGLYKKLRKYGLT